MYIRLIDNLIVPFEELYKSTFQYVYRFFYYKSVNQADIEDLAHEVFIRFYNKYRERNLELAESKRILFGISSNVYKEWVRKCVKERRADFLDNYDYVDEDSEDVFAQEEFEEKLDGQKKILVEKLNELNPKMKFILEARFIHGRTRKDIAEELGIKEKDVHTYQKRGIKYLKKLMNN